MNNCSKNELLKSIIFYDDDSNT